MIVCALVFCCLCHRAHYPDNKYNLRGEDIISDIILIEWTATFLCVHSKALESARWWADDREGWDVRGNLEGAVTHSLTHACTRLRNALNPPRRGKTWFICHRKYIGFTHMTHNQLHCLEKSSIGDFSSLEFVLVYHFIITPGGSFTHWYIYKVTSTEGQGSIRNQVASPLRQYAAVAITTLNLPWIQMRV